MHSVSAFTHTGPELLSSALKWTWTSTLKQSFLTLHVVRWVASSSENYICIHTSIFKHKKNLLHKVKTYSGLLIRNIVESSQVTHSICLSLFHSTSSSPYYTNRYLQMVDYTNVHSFSTINSLWDSLLNFRAFLVGDIHLQHQLTGTTVRPGKASVSLDEIQEH